MRNRLSIESKTSLVLMKKTIYFEKMILKKSPRDCLNIGDSFRDIAKSFFYGSD